jgi:glycosyltransferase involved in cell wall biosynthesis
MKRVALVGPVAPFRGGVAQHTTRLAEALAQRTGVDVMSFARLYPGFLYPGKSQTEDAATHLPDTATVSFHIDSLNPITWRRAIARLRASPPRFVVIPWWTFFLAPCFYFLSARLRAIGVPVIFICHNVVDHEAADWKRWLSKRVMQHGTAFVVHSTKEQEKLVDLLGPVNVVYHPQPIFDHFPRAQGTLPRKAAVELLFFGFIRSYKGLLILLDAVSRVRDLDVHLSIVGEPWGEHEEVWRARIRAAGIEQNVEFVPGYASAVDSAEYFHRADAVVLPYTAATGPAVLAAAYHYRKPVLASRVGGLVDIVEHGITGLLFPPGDPARLAAAIRCFAAERLTGAPAAIERLSPSMSWDGLAERILGLA